MPAAPSDIPASARLGSDNGLLAVQVPQGAKVFVNGRPTRTSGLRRTYVSTGLQAGRSYRYEVRAEIEHEGQTLQQTKVAHLRAGSSAQLDFDFDVAAQTETRLTLNVPDDAKVTLAGAETKMEGTRRVFETSKLSSGEAWTDYTVHVSVNRGGNELTQEKTITLQAGESRELSFEFNQDQLAAAR